jgi:hypothetical protein
MDEKLIRAYQSTSYNIYNPKISIRIGETNDELDALLLENNCKSYAFVTAYNPYSELKSKEDNQKRNEILHQELKGQYRLFDGEGVGADISWEPEKSFLILGIDYEKAKEIGLKYSQNAIVFGHLGEKPELLVLVS